MRVLIGVVLALGIAGHATAAELSTWSGTIGLVQEHGLNHPTTKLAFGASSSRTDFTGLTGAAHDALNAKPPAGPPGASRRRAAPGGTTARSVDLT
jgi:hypothetical protein